MIRPDHRTGWRLFLAALVAWGMSGALWIVALRERGSSGWSAGADLAFLVGGVLCAVSLISNPDLDPTPRRVRVVLDASIVAVSSAALLWLAVGRELFARTDDLLGTATSVLNPATDTVVIVVALALTLRARGRAVGTTTAAIVAAAFTVLLIGHGGLLIRRTYGGGGSAALLVEGCFAVALALIALAVIAAGRDRTRVLWARDSSRLRSAAWIPVGTAFLAALAVLGDAARSGSFDKVSMLGLVALVVATLARQSMTLADNHELASSLQVTVDHLELQATHDPLTGLPNRAGLVERIDEAMQCALERHAHGAVLFVDLDHLKAVNDSIGHRAGDVMIATIADRLRARCGATVTRFGGDEFVIALDDVSSPSTVETLGRLIIDDAGQPVTVDGHTLRPSVSVGIALAQTGVGPDEMLRRADVALYRAKASGRRRVTTYHPRLDAGARSRLDLEPELRRAIERSEFEVHYQPIVDLPSGEVVAAEALLRWRHPERGVLAPDSFLGEAVANGLLGTIGAQTLQRVGADFSPRSRLAGLPASVAVNLSTSELTDRRVTERVADALSRHGLDPQQLTIEITEDVVVDHSVRRTIDELRELGVGLAIDDFGTGNSSLRQMGTYPADVLKIDKRFIDQLEHDEQAVVVTGAIIRLAEHLGLRTVAEGVEHAEQVELLVALGCQRAQGWRFARAMPIHELAAWCADRTATAASDPERVPTRYAPSRVSVSSASDMIRASSSATVGRSTIAPTT